MKEEQRVYLEVLRKFGDGTRSHGLLALDNLTNASRDICLGCLGLGCLVDGNDQVWHDVRGNLHVRLDESREEIQHRVEGDARHQRRVCHGVDVLEKIVLDFRERSAWRDLKKKGDNVKGRGEKGYFTDRNVGLELRDQPCGEVCGNDAVSVQARSRSVYAKSVA